MKYLSAILLLVVFTAVADTQYVRHQVYRVKYDSDTKNPRWVSWVLSSNMVVGISSRLQKFYEDPEIKIPQGTHYDYTGSGYDRGHMCPAADNSFSQEAMKESFYVSNICPQLPRLNRGRWKSLEEECRRRVLQDDTLVIVAGPIYSDSVDDTIGVNKIKVPAAFFKVIYDGRLEYAYIFSNVITNLYELNVSVDDV